MMGKNHKMDDDCEAEDFSSHLVWTSSWCGSCSGYISSVLNLDWVLGTREKPLQQPRVRLRHLSVKNFCKTLGTEVIRTAGLPANTLNGFLGGRISFWYYLRCGCDAGWPTTAHSLHNVDKPVVGRLTAWCAIPWLGVYTLSCSVQTCCYGKGPKRNEHIWEFITT